MTDTPSSSWTDRLLGGFKRTSDRLGDNLLGLFSGGKLDADTLDRIEDALIVSDLGPAMAARIRAKLASGRYDSGLDETALRAL
jgi:fused signal recognition particle receptor